MYVMLLRVATLRYYNTHVCLDAGVIENPKLYLNFKANPQTFFDTCADNIVIINFVACYMWLWAVFTALFEQ